MEAALRNPLGVAHDEKIEDAAHGIISWTLDAINPTFIAAGKKQNGMPSEQSEMYILTESKYEVT